MDILHRELEDLIDEVAPTFIDIEQLERLVTEDDMLAFEGEGTTHAGCRQIAA